jgi:hypothetical protein
MQSHKESALQKASKGPIFIQVLLLYQNLRLGNFFRKEFTVLKVQEYGTSSICWTSGEGLLRLCA